jgi:hypothetical protein
MKAPCLATAFIAALVILSAGSALAARKSATVEGILGVSSAGKSMLKAARDSDEGYFFDPGSEAGKKILAVCQQGKLCIVKGVVNFKNIMNVYYIRLGE